MNERKPWIDGLMPEQVSFGSILARCVRSMSGAARPFRAAACPGTRRIRRYRAAEPPSRDESRMALRFFVCALSHSDSCGCYALPGAWARNRATLVGDR